MGLALLPEDCEHDYEVDEERACLYCRKCDHPPKERAMTIVTTTQVKPKDSSMRDLLIFEMAVREAQRRAKRRNPPAHWLAEVLDELGLKVMVV